MDLVEHLLAEAISDCYSAMEKLGERGSDSRTWDHISAELAMAYLTVRKLLFYLAFDHSDFDVLLSLSSFSSVFDVAKLFLRSRLTRPRHPRLKQ